jgi:hypothetical protein
MAICIEASTSIGVERHPPKPRLESPLRQKRLPKEASQPNDMLAANSEQSCEDIIPDFIDSHRDWRQASRHGGYRKLITLTERLVTGTKSWFRQ